GLSDYVLKKRNHIHRLTIAVGESLEKQRLRQEYASAIEKVRVSEENLRFALEAGNIIAFNWNIQTGEVRRSLNADQIIGLKPEESYTTSFQATLNLIHPEVAIAFKKISELP
ncbi:MAG: hypothetical protein C4322_21085, partial [Mastigocladus sp. ERB_26_1]